MMTSDASLPDYAPLLRAFHAGFAAELAAMVATLPIEIGQSVLEVACGDGAYTPWLADRVGTSGLVVGLDLSAGFLRLARRAVDPAGPTHLVAASVDRLPFAPASFDVAWCAQSLFSLPDPLEVVRRMAAMVRPGGLVAVLEDDSLHQVLLPWPVDVELSARAAEWALLRKQVANPAKFYVGRRLIEVFAEAGLRELKIKTFAADRAAPLDPDSRAFFAEYLQQLRDSVAPTMEAAARGELERWIDPGSADYLLDAPTFAATVIDHVVQGRRP